MLHDGVHLSHSHIRHTIYWDVPLSDFGFPNRENVLQAIITYCGKSKCSVTELGCHDGLVCDIFKIVGDYPVAQHFFVSNYIDVSYDIKDVIRSLSFPYLRRCALLWKVMNSSISAPFGGGAQVFDSSSHSADEMMGYGDGNMVELVEVEKLEKMFKIPQLDVVLNDEVLRPLVSRWFHHFLGSVIGNHQNALHLTPAVPLKLMHLPHLYQDLLQRSALDTLAFMFSFPSFSSQS